MALMPLHRAGHHRAAILVAPGDRRRRVRLGRVTAVYVGSAHAKRAGHGTFMSYFFSRYLRAKLSELPWLTAPPWGACAASLESLLDAGSSGKCSAGEHSGAVARMAMSWTPRRHRAGRPERRAARTTAADPDRPPQRDGLMVRPRSKTESTPPRGGRGQRRGPRPLVVRRRAHVERLARPVGPRGGHPHRQPSQLADRGHPVAGHPDTAAQGLCRRRSGPSN